MKTFIILDFDPFVTSFWDGKSETFRKYQNVTFSSRQRLDKILGDKLNSNEANMSILDISGNEQATLLIRVLE